MQLNTLPIKPWRFHYGRHPEQGRQTTPFFASTGLRIANGWPWPRPSSRLQKADPVYIYRNQEGRTILDSTIEDAKAMGMTDETSLEALLTWADYLPSTGEGHQLRVVRFPGGPPGSPNTLPRPQAGWTELFDVCF